MSGTAEAEIQPSVIEKLFWAAYLRLEPSPLSGLQMEYAVACEGAGRLCYIDFALPEKKIGIELDGYEFHSDPGTFHEDRERELDLQMLGWTLFRFSGRMVKNNADKCVKRAAALTARWTGELQGGEELLADFSIRQPKRTAVDTHGAFLYLANRDGSGKDLTKANLRWSDLRGVNLRKANLAGADLTGANLFQADLRGAKFTNATLQKADLRGAKFTNATLQEADLRGADLRGANLQGADLDACNFSKARLDGTTIWTNGMRWAKEVDLTGAPL